MTQAGGANRAGAFSNFKKSPEIHKNVLDTVTNKVAIIKEKKTNVAAVLSINYENKTTFI